MAGRNEVIKEDAFISGVRSLHPQTNVRDDARPSFLQRSVNALKNPKYVFNEA